jgi:hypothetical protein
MGIHPKVTCYHDIFELPLEDLVALVAKEAGEMIDSVYIDQDDHWKNELGDLCGLLIPPLLAKAGLTFQQAEAIGIRRFNEKIAYKLRGEKAPSHKDIQSPANKSV